jgi:hypothetical protein
MNPAVLKVAKIIKKAQPKIGRGPKFPLTNISRTKTEPEAPTGLKTLPRKVARNFKKGPKFFPGSTL